MPKPKHRNQHPPAVTKAKQRDFLNMVQTTGSHGLACKAADIHIATPTIWANKNELFRKNWEKARELGEQVILLKYETSLDSTVLDHDSFDEVCKSQVLRMFRMKRLDPRYRDNAPAQVNIAGPVNILFGSDQPNTAPVDITPHT